jgi:prepilin-type N-terminal cleavage/methylation domain-containing protein
MKVSFKGGKKNRAGFTLIEVILVITIIGLLVGIGLPNYMKARDNSRLNVIYSNLRQIEEAKSQWAIENKKNTGDVVDDLASLNTYFRGGKIADVMSETYVPNSVGTPAEADLPTGVGLGPYSSGGSIAAP